MRWLLEMWILPAKEGQPPSAQHGAVPGTCISPTPLPLAVRIPESHKSHSTPAWAELVLLLTLNNTQSRRVPHRSSPLCVGPRGAVENHYIFKQQENNSCYEKHKALWKQRSSRGLSVTQEKMIPTAGLKKSAQWWGCEIWELLGDGGAFPLNIP